MRQISGNDRRVDRADRGAGDPVWPYAAFFERGISSRLVGSERPAARQHQGDPFETGQALFRSSSRQTVLPTGSRLTDR